MEAFNRIAPYLIIPLVAVFVYFMYMRPQKRVDKKQEAGLRALKPGDEVITISGVFALVAETHEDCLILSVIPGGTLMKVKPQAIAVFPGDMRKSRALEDTLDKMDKGEDFDPEYRKGVK